MSNNDFPKKLFINAIEEEANDVKLFYLQEQEGAINYKSGQYLTFLLPKSEIEVRRSYSLVSSPAANEKLCIAVKRIVNGIFSRYLYDWARVGDELITLGPGGIFVLPLNIESYNTLFFFAAGSGIVPIFSLIKTALILHPHLQVVLIYSNSSENSTIFYDSLNKLAEDYRGRFAIEFLFSNTKQLESARLNTGLVEQFVNRYSKGNFDKDLCYICGPESYMRLCIFSLRGMHVPAANIRKEIFDISKPVPQQIPPDTSPHLVTLIRDDHKYELVVQHPLSILATAKREGISLPYSCETGRCGNCMAKCESGKIWMSYNEVLTAKEIKSGYILTCTGYPVEGDAIISL